MRVCARTHTHIYIYIYIQTYICLFEIDMKLVVIAMHLMHLNLPVNCMSNKLK